jgi:hypothetical protein
MHRVVKIIGYIVLEGTRVRSVFENNSDAIEGLCKDRIEHQEDVGNG